MKFTTLVTKFKIRISFNFVEIYWATFLNFILRYYFQLPFDDFVEGILENTIDWDPNYSLPPESLDPAV
jgi:hypothetical protein